jgi:hypothetical protein
MKITDLIVEQKLDEKPMGALAGLGNKIASKFGSGKAMGKLDTGKIANDLRKQFDVYLGKTGQQADAQVITDFLSSMGLPTDAVNASSASTTAPAQDMKTTLGIGKNAGQPMAVRNPSEPKMDPTAPMPKSSGPSDPAAGDATNYDTPTYQRKGVADPVTQPMDRNKFNQSALKARLKAGAGAGKVKTGFGAYKAAAAAKGLKAGMYDSVSYESLRQEMFLTEALSAGQVDKIFLATAQLMAKQGMTGAGSAPQGGGQTAQAGAGGPGLIKSFVQGFKDTDGQKGQAGAFNKTQSKDQDFSGNLNFNQLAKLLPNTDQQALVRALRLVISGSNLNQQQLGVLGVAMTDIVKADAQTTSKIMQTLKRISAE